MDRFGGRLETLPAAQDSSATQDVKFQTQATTTRLVRKDVNMDSWEAGVWGANKLLLLLPAALDQLPPVELPLPVG